jgi:hypothetical protein
VLPNHLPGRISQYLVSTLCGLSIPLLHCLNRRHVRVLRHAVVTEINCKSANSIRHFNSIVNPFFGSDASYEPLRRYAGLVALLRRYRIIYMPKEKTKSPMLTAFMPSRLNSPDLRRSLTHYPASQRPGIQPPLQSMLPRLHLTLPIFAAPMGDQFLHGCLLISQCWRLCHCHP